MTARRYLPLLVAAASGLIFGVGLAFAQMTNPEKVKNFLDLAAIGDGTWDPSLIFVMGAGLVVMFLFYRLAAPRRAPVIGAAFSTFPPPQIDRQLVIGSAVFGIGWGMAGLCPGPAIADLGLAPGQVALFVAAMLAGSWGAGLYLSARDSGPPLIHRDVPAQ